MQAFEDEATSDKLESQALALEIQRRLDDAALHYKRARAARERILGASATKTLKSGVDVARCLSRQGRHAEALTYCEPGLKWIKANPSGVDLSTALRVRRLYGDILRGIGRLKDAVAEYKVALELDTEKTEHGITLNSLGGVYREMGRYSEALNCYSETYADAKKMKGEESVEALSILNNIATAILDDGKSPETSLKLFEKVYNGYLKIRGETDPNTLSTAANISATFHKLGRFQEAEKWGRNALRNAEKTFGEENQPTLSIANALGLTLTSLGRFDEAEEILEDCLSGLMTVYGAENSLTLTTRCNLAIVIRAKGDLARALKEQESVYGIFARLLGAGHPSTRKVIQQVISIQAELGRYADAVKNQKILVDEMLKMGPPHGGHVKCMEKLADYYRKSGDNAKGKETDARVTRLREEIQR